MAAHELARNGATRYAVFSIDGSGDIASLPTSKKAGSGDLKLSPTCSQGSLAKGTDNTNYILNGKDTWVKYAGSVDNGGGGGSIPSDDYDRITEEEIDDLLE